MRAGQNPALLRAEEGAAWHFAPEFPAQWNAWRENSEKLVFTNGVFDLLHRGHVTYLEAARAAGDRLVVGVNSDASVRRLGKGEDRPIHNEQDRAFVLAALRCVDAVIIFSEDTPAGLIAWLQPDVLVKGGDYDPMEEDPQDRQYMVGREVVLARGGQVLAIPLVAGHSTTAIIARTRRT
jgi:rfaE bifunctional protein nucleotidyltransferase chain/domain